MHLYISYNLLFLFIILFYVILSIQYIFFIFCNFVLFTQFFVVFLPIQKRTREKLVNVLTLCGQEVGLTKNPSVSDA